MQRFAYLAFVAMLASANLGLAQEKLNFEKAAAAWTLPWDADWVTAVALTSPTRTLVAGNKAGQMLAWKLPEKTGAPLPQPFLAFDNHANQVSAIVPLPDGRHVISASFDHTLRLWDLQASPKGKTTVHLKSGVKKKSGEKDDGISLPVIEPIKIVKDHSEWIRCLSLSPDGKQLVSADDKGEIILWNVPEFKEVKRFQMKGWVQAVALSPDGKSIVACVSAVRYSQFPNAITQFDAATGTTKNLGETLMREKGRQAVLGVAATNFSIDGKTLAFAVGGEIDGANGKVLLIESATGKRVHDLPGHLSGNTAVVFHPDGQHVLTTGRDTIIRVWRLTDGKQVVELGKSRGGQFRDWLHNIAITPDGQWIAGGDMAGMVHVWYVPK